MQLCLRSQVPGTVAIELAPRDCKPGHQRSITVLAAGERQEPFAVAESWNQGVLVSFDRGVFAANSEALRKVVSLIVAIASRVRKAW